VGRAARLYEVLRARRIPYSHAPWNPVPYGPAEQARYGSAGTLQRVRAPSETLQGPATCLDLALLFAGMAMAADMRPFIGLKTTGKPHALVVLPLQRPRSIPGTDDAKPPGFTQRAADPGVWDLDEPYGLPSFADREDWQVVDVFRAAWRPGSSDERLGWPAGEAIRNELADVEQAWTLVDVDRVRSAPTEPYELPRGPSVPAIYGYLPAFPSFIEYPTRKKLLKDLHRKVGPSRSPKTIVLYGKPGSGKSMLAHRLAIAADHGCGWFLNATDDKILTRSLAQAERQEMGPRGDAIPEEGVDAAEERALASEALRRLRGSDEPWVVVLDNCDSRPDLAGLSELIPEPRTDGQVVIITTKEAAWQEEAMRQGWSQDVLPPLEGEDLGELGLPSGTNGTVYDTPLIAQALAALHKKAGVALPPKTGTDGPALVWHLLRLSEHRQPGVGDVTRLLAWCPPEPMDAELLGKIAGWPQGVQAGERLAELSFVSPSRNDGRLAVQLHRLFAAAVRDQVWRDNPAMAAGIVTRLLRTEEGRRIFIEAADSTALGRLERAEQKPEEGDGSRGDVARAAGCLTDPSGPGLLWYDLGHVRELRGPVAASGPHFEQALRTLDRGMYPYEVAESLIGRARVVFQNPQSSADQLAGAQDWLTEARDRLAPSEDPDARQLREQGNALSWLIARKLAGRERNPRKREARLAEVTEQLWRSYEERLRLVRGPGTAIERMTPPVYKDGLGAERAYYNLAGTYIELAKVRYDLALGEPPASERHRELLRQANADLTQARVIYQDVRRLRGDRYHGQPHPHLAACVQGEAIVVYYRAALLGEYGELMESFELAAEAMRQRQVVAGGLVGPGSPAVLRDGDMRKSEQFLLKVAIAMLFAGTSRPAPGVESVLGEAREAMMEVFGRVTWPSQIQLTGVPGGGN
jgi:hypothetical protein